MSNTDLDSASLLLDDLKRSRALPSNELWGKQAIQAIDLDNPVKVAQIFNARASLSATLNERVNARGYIGYVWTPWIRTFQGDTIVHIAVKQRKINALCALLLFDPDLSIVNDEGLSAGDLCLSILEKDIKEYQQEAYVSHLILSLFSEYNFDHS